MRGAYFHSLDLTCSASDTFIMRELYRQAYLTPVIIVRDPSDNGRLNRVQMPGPEPATCPHCDCAAQWAVQCGGLFVRGSPDQHQVIE